MSTVFITGASGFVGAHLVRRLLTQGSQVVALLRAPDRSVRFGALVEQLPTAHRSLLTILAGDLLDRERLQAVVAEWQPEVVYHLAATGVNPAASTPAEVVQGNVVGTLNLLEVCRDSALRRFVYAGSCAEYGSGRDLNEAMLPAPTNVYGASKAAAGLLVQTYRRTYGLPAVWLRPFMIYGPLERRGRLVINTILTALSGEDMRMTGGEQERDFIYVDDVVEGFIRAADDAYSAAIGETINLCSGVGLPIREVVTLILELMGNPVKAVLGAIPYREGEMWLQSGDNTRARRLLDWSPRVGLREGLERTIAWCREHRELAEMLVQ